MSLDTSPASKALDSAAASGSPARPAGLVRRRLRYYQRIFSAYVGGSNSHLTFWHGEPSVNEGSDPHELGGYYMPFSGKADYPGPYDGKGVPLLDYHGAVGQQYNPIAIAQYGLGNYNQFLALNAPDRRTRFLTAADWMVENLEQNSFGEYVWNHQFDWEYRTPLKAPWYSALSQGQGISLLVRAHQETRDPHYLEAAKRAFRSFLAPMSQGGVTFVDDDGLTWFEEAIVEPPTHILNGFLWACWGVYDYNLATGSDEARRLFGEATRTLKSKLRMFDTGFWSLYELAGERMLMLASPFYHKLHIVQLRVMHRLTGDSYFLDCAEKWESYRSSRLKSTYALCYKALFKLLYY